MTLFQQIDTLRWLIRHPLNVGRRLAACGNWLAWHIGSRLAPGPVAVPFVDRTVLLVGPGMTGLTLNVYAGLAEPDDMAFALHLLRPGDLFVDIGANAGVYAVLAGAAGADIVAFEPLPVPFEQLSRNIAVNDLTGRATLFNIGLGETAGALRFSSDQGPMNHVLTSDDDHDGTEVAVRRLDDVLSGRRARLIKIDVEGFEIAVLRGAPGLLADAELAGLIVELNGSGVRYGWPDILVEELLGSYGFLPIHYDFRTRTVTRAASCSSSGNTIFVRDLEPVAARVKGAPCYAIGPHRIPV